MLNDYQEKQPLFYNYMSKALSKNKINHAYLIETNGVEYGFDLAMSLSKSFLCPNNYMNKELCNTCNICFNIDSNNYPDLKIIDTDNKIIKKEEVLSLEKSFSVKPIYGKYMIYIIKNANLLNNSSANTILKFLEEPKDNIIAILLTDSIYNVIDTIVSRCQLISLIPENTTNNLLFKKYYSEKNTNFDQYIEVETANILEFYKNIETNGVKTLAIDNPYQLKEKMDLVLNIGLKLYSDVLHKKLNINQFYYENNQMVNNISNLNSINDIMKKISTINLFDKINKLNVNKDLFMDNFIISLGGCKND